MLINVQGLRFVAAAMVLFFHLVPHVWATGYPRHGWSEAIHLVGFAGVDIFFVISGFVIWHTTRHVDGAHAAWSFLRRRLARIYVGYWPFMLLAALVLLLLNRPQLLQRDWLASLVLYPQEPGALLIPVSWTLTFELYFYSAFAGVLLLRRVVTKSVLLVALAAFVGIIALDMAWTLRGDGAAVVSDSIYPRFFFSPLCLEFIAGCGLAFSAARVTLPRPALLLALAVAGFVGAGTVNAWAYDGSLVQLTYITARLLLFGPPAVLLVAGILGLEQRGRVFWRAAALPLGAASYGIYLAHTVVLRLLYELGIRDALTGSALVLPVYFGVAALTVAGCVAHYHRVERPLYHWALRWLAVRHSGSVTPRREVV